MQGLPAGDYRCFADVRDASGREVFARDVAPGDGGDWTVRHVFAPGRYAIDADSKGGLRFHDGVRRHGGLREREHLRRAPGALIGLRFGGSRAARYTIGSSFEDPPR